MVALGCCGQARTAVAAALRPTETRRPAGAGPVPDAPVRYLGSRPVHVRGSVTGRRYSFTTGGEVRRVDGRDVAGIVRTRLFARS